MTFGHMEIAPVLGGSVKNTGTLLTHVEITPALLGRVFPARPRLITQHEASASALGTASGVSALRRMKLAQATGNGAASTSASATSGPAPFDATAFPGLQGWYDAQAESFANNDPVGTFTDRSSNARHLTQSTTSKKPTYMTNRINGFPSLKFGGDDLIRGDSIYASGVMDKNGTTNVSWSIYLVFKSATAVSQATRRIWCLYNFPLSVNFVDFIYPTFSASPAALTVEDQNVSLTDSTSTLTTNPQVICVSYEGESGTNKGKYRIYVNGTLTAASSSFVGAAAIWNSLVLGTILFSSIPNGTNFFDGDLGEFVVYNQLHSTTDRNAAINRLKAKWGIT